MKMFEGDPVRPHVDRLMEGVEPKVGDRYQHDDLAHIAGVKYRTGRYFAVMGAWKKRLRDLGFDLQVNPGIGYIVLTANESVDAGCRDARFSVRKMRRALSRISRANVAELDEIHRRRYDHAATLRQIVDDASRGVREMTFAARAIGNPRAPGEQAA